MVFDDKKEEKQSSHEQGHKEHESLEEQPAFHQIRTEHSSGSHTTHPSSSPPTNDTTHTPAEEQDSTKTFFIALGLFIVILGAIFLIPRFFSDEPQTLNEIHQENLGEQKDTETAYVYNGYSFVYYDGLWYTQIYNQFAKDLYDVPLHFGPKNLTDIVITGDINPFFGGILTSNISNSSSRFYLTFSPNDPKMGYVALASGELTQNLVTTFNIAPVSACTEEGSGCEMVPLVTCDSTDQP
ncbi:MAG: hypothetical protein AABX98_04295, partial [Nanoarchaeota archaeon]